MTANAYKEKKNQKRRTEYFDSEVPPQYLKNKT